MKGPHERPFTGVGQAPDAGAGFLILPIYGELYTSERRQMLAERNLTCADRAAKFWQNGWILKLASPFKPNVARKYMPESPLRQRLSEQFISNWARGHAGTSINPRDPASLPAHHLRTWDRTYGHLVRDLPDGSEVLDLGCGTGLLLYWLRRYRNIRPVGVDISPGMVEVARTALPDVEIHCADGLAFLHSNISRFSGIFCFAVLEHIPDESLLEFVEACVHSLRPGGFFCCLTPNAANFITGSYSRYMDLTHVRSFTSNSLIQLLEAAGLKDCTVVPLRPGRPIGVVRHVIEHCLHRAFFLVANFANERVFSWTLSVVGYRK